MALIILQKTLQKLKAARHSLLLTSRSVLSTSVMRTKDIQQHTWKVSIRCRLLLESPMIRSLRRHLFLKMSPAQMLLKTWCSISRNAVAPHVFRYGELYGEADAFPTHAGHVNECLALARQGKTLVFYGNLNQARTLTHVDDFASAVAAVLQEDFTPSRINIPGEKVTVAEFLQKIAEHYGVEWELTTQRPSVLDENVPYLACDRLLNAAVFKSIVPDFKPKHKFANWLAVQPIELKA